MSLFKRLCRRLCLSIRVHRSENSLSSGGSHYLSSFWELSKSIWIVFLIQNFRELATVASFEIIRLEVLRSKVHLPNCVHRSNSSRKLINVSCIVCVVSGVTNFDYSRGYQNNILKNKEKPKKYVSFALLFKQRFILKDGLYSGYLLFFSRRTTVPVFTRWHSTGRYS